MGGKVLVGGYAHNDIQKEEESLLRILRKNWMILVSFGTLTEHDGITCSDSLSSIRRERDTVMSHGFIKKMEKILDSGYAHNVILKGEESLLQAVLKNWTALA